MREHGSPLARPVVGFAPETPARELQPVFGQIPGRRVREGRYPELILVPASTAHRAQVMALGEHRIDGGDGNEWHDGSVWEGREYPENLWAVGGCRGFTITIAPAQGAARDRNVPGAA